MRQTHPIWKLATVLVIFVGFGALLRLGVKPFEEKEKKPAPKNSILHLELEGVIMNGKKFLSNLKKYGDEENVKAVLISINSPGGAVGPSQEINAEINRLRVEKKKPVICVSSGLMASGAYYSAVACDKIIVAPGALVGSIGVIMEFANLEKLYDWARVSRYSITSGRFKDSGAEYRPMREDERALFQDMINEVYSQFKEAVMKGRPQMKEDVVTSHADGRVFNGKKAVELGFADEIGYYEDAVKVTAQAANLGDDYEIYEPPRSRRSLWDFGDDHERDPVNTLAEAAKDLMKLKMLNQPLYLMPGTW